MVRTFGMVQFFRSFYLFHFSSTPEHCVDVLVSVFSAELIFLTSLGAISENSPFFYWPISLSKHFVRGLGELRESYPFICTLIFQFQMLHLEFLTMNSVLETELRAGEGFCSLLLKQNFQIVVGNFHCLGALEQRLKPPISMVSKPGPWGLQFSGVFRPTKQKFAAAQVWFIMLKT